MNWKTPLKTKKTCKHCLSEKALIDFPKHCDGKDGHLNICKDCRSIARKKVYERNREHELTTASVRRLQNPERYNEVSKKWKSENVEKVLESYRKHKETNFEKIRERKRNYDNSRKATDLNYKIQMNLRSRMYQAIKKELKGGSAVRDLGCSIEELKTHLESQFQSGMTWENWSRNGWHIDHIVPLASFDLTNREEFLKAANYTNLQPLWAKENYSKNKHRKKYKTNFRA